MKHALLTLILTLPIVSLRAEYVETLKPDAPENNLQKDFGLVDDNAATNQSEKLQKAIDSVSESGGGKLVIPKGTYKFAGIRMKSNVHLFIAKDTVIRPQWSEDGKTGIFSMGAPRGERSHIENVSIRGDGGKFIIDYSDGDTVPNKGIRAIMFKEVRNFLVSDILIKDAFTSYCALSFGIHKGDLEGMEVFRPTDGLVRDLEATNTSPGYGLLQMHAGEKIHFENLRAIGGGVTFRLETGAGGKHGGVHQITAKNLYCENGSTAVMLGPHTAQNGVVKIDGVTAKSCGFAATMGPGFIEPKHQHDPDYKQGIFGEGTTVKNIHAIFGTNAAISLKGIGNVPREYLKDLKFDPNDTRALKRVRGPSVGVVRDSTGDSWNPIIENVTCEGFTHNKGIIKQHKKERANWREVLEGLPIMDQLSTAKNAPKKPEKTRNSNRARPWPAIPKTRWKQ